MAEVYRVRGGIEPVSDDDSTKRDLLDAAKEVKEIGTADASFSRGELHLLDDEVVFAPGINESTVANVINNVLSKGPIDLTTLGIYDPYESSLEDADQYSGSWRMSYADIDGVSVLSKANGYEVFLRPRDRSDRLYRIRVGPMDPIGFRWLYSPTHDTAVELAGELFERASQYGNVAEFNAGGHFPVRTKQVEFPSESIGSEPATSTESEPSESATTPAAEPSPGDTATTETPEPEAGAGSDSTDTDDVSWLGSTEEPRLVIENAGAVRRTVKAGVRVDSEPVFTAEVELGAGESHTVEDLPAEPCQIGVVTADDRTASTDIDPAELTSDARIVVDDDRIAFAAPTVESEATATTEPERTAASAHSATGRTKAGTETKTEASPEGREKTDRDEAPSTATSASTNDGGRVSSGTFYLLGLGIAAVVVVPFTDWPFLMEVIQRTAVVEPPLYIRGLFALFPSLLGSGFGYGALTSGPAGGFPVAWPVMFLLAAAIPLTLVVDLVSVRRRTQWTPNIVLYPLGAILLWFVTVPLYLRRRRRADATE